jgi:hypothetical protein
MLHDREVVSSPRPRGGSEVEDIRWPPEIQAEYDQFLHDERNYVTEGVWDRFPPGSRLFVGMILMIYHFSHAMTTNKNVQAIYPLKR